MNYCICLWLLNNLIEFIGPVFPWLILGQISVSASSANKQEKASSSLPFASLDVEKTLNDFIVYPCTSEYAFNLNLRQGKILL